jgi:hypothetical protein
MLLHIFYKITQIFRDIIYNVLIALGVAENHQKDVLQLMRNLQFSIGRDRFMQCQQFLQFDLKRVLGNLKVYDFIS